jgi:hypothetical protein
MKVLGVTIGALLDRLERRREMNGATPDVTSRIRARKAKSASMRPIPRRIRRATILDDESRILDAESRNHLSRRRVRRKALPNRAESSKQARSIY